MKKIIFIVSIFSLLFSSCSFNQETETNHEDYLSEDSGNSIVYMTSSIDSKAMLELFKKIENGLNSERTAVKLSIGEPPNSNYLRTDLIEDTVTYVNGTIVECNTAYGGSRSDTESHYQVAREHGYTNIADVDILDEEGSVPLNIENGNHLDENLVGSHFNNYDGYLVLSHFKGHQMAGFGGAIKNISIGLASSEGKSLIHSGGTKTSGFSGDTISFLESMPEAAKSVVDALNGNIVYINVMNRLSIDCDCNGNPAEPDIHDIGILASTDPVALDQACVDLIYNAENNEAFIERMEGIGAERTLEYSQEIGLGNRSYNLVEI